MEEDCVGMYIHPSSCIPGDLSQALKKKASIFHSNRQTNINVTTSSHYSSPLLRSIHTINHPYPVNNLVL